MHLIRGETQYHVHSLRFSWQWGGVDEWTIGLQGGASNPDGWLEEPVKLVQEETELACLTPLSVYSSGQDIQRLRATKFPASWLEEAPTTSAHLAAFFDSLGVTSSDEAPFASQGVWVHGVPPASGWTRLDLLRHYLSEWRRTGRGFLALVPGAAAKTWEVVQASDPQWPELALGPPVTIKRERGAAGPRTAWMRDAMGDGVTAPWDAAHIRCRHHSLLVAALHAEWKNHGPWKCTRLWRPPGPLPIRQSPGGLITARFNGMAGSPEGERGAFCTVECDGRDWHCRLATPSTGDGREHLGVHFPITAGARVLVDFSDPFRWPAVVAEVRECGIPEVPGVYLPETLTLSAPDRLTLRSTQPEIVEE